MRRDDLARVLARTRTRAGARRAAEAAVLLDERSRSRPESHLRIAVSGPDMPPFDVNEPIYRDEGGWLAEPDLSLREAKLALEYQGRDHAEVNRMHRDITRELDMHRDDWLTLAFGPREVFIRPDQVRSDVYRVIRCRAPQLFCRPGRRVRSDPRPDAVAGGHLEPPVVSSVTQWALSERQRRAK
jgi:hypothetical protein